MSDAGPSAEDANMEPPASTPANSGAMLVAARIAAGMALTDVAAKTRIPLRHLEALEAGNHSGLPSQTYAIGFARAHARATGADEVAIARQVRDEIDRTGKRAPEFEPYELPDPARVPSRRVAIVGAGLALAVLVLIALWYGGAFRHDDTPAPTQVAAPTLAPEAPAAALPAKTTPQPDAGRVTLTAEDDVWLRIYDADGKRLFERTMKPSDHYDVPPDAKDPMINIGRPDKLAVTLNGAAMPRLGTGERAIKDVKVGAAAIAARVKAEAGEGSTSVNQSGADDTR